MTVLHFEITVNATAKKVWQILWSDSTYRRWTAPFYEGSHAVSDWKEGSSIQFLSPDGNGMFSKITKCKPYECMQFTHLGEIKNFEEQTNDASKSWNGLTETYILTEVNGQTILKVETDTLEQFKDYMATTFPKAVQVVKELSEQPLMLTVTTFIQSSPEQVWKFFTTPYDIMQWNTASDDWHTTKSENDLRTGGKFYARMEAKDGSFGFDFSGVYDEVINQQFIRYSLDDGRKVEITFSVNNQGTNVRECFEAETENSPELQQGGWQAILNNFKKYVEENQS